jgi:hypothetical protein
MAVSRRHLLQLGPALLTAAAVPLRAVDSVLSSDGSAAASRLSLPSRESFRALINSSFAVRSGDQVRSWLTLLSIEDMSPKAPDYQPPMAVAAPKGAAPTVEAFALHFVGSGDPLSQATYALEHRALGRFDLFVVPAGADRYTAVFSRLTSPGPTPPAKRVSEKPGTGKS